MRSALRVLSGRPLPAGQVDDGPHGPAAHLVAALDALPELPVDRFVRVLARETGAGARALAYLGAADLEAVTLTAVLQRPTGLAVLRGRLSHGTALPRLGAALPRLAALEAELAARCDLPLGPPLELRRRDDDPDPDATYFWPKDQPADPRPPPTGRTLHLGPLRLACDGEIVRDVTVHRDHAPRGVDSLLLRRPRAHLPALVETLAGDTGVAHASAHAAAIEGLAGTGADLVTATTRAIALELERIAVDLAALAALADTIGYLPGAEGFARLRGAVLDLTQRTGGSRFARGWIRPGAAGPAIDDVRRADLRDTLGDLTDRLAPLAARAFAARTVRERLDGVGGLARADADALGMTGLLARASGLDRDLRRELPGALYLRHPVAALREPYGDCLTRLSARTREVDASARWIAAVLTDGPLRPTAPELGELAPDHLALAAVEGPRGPVVHLLETDAAGRIARYLVQDAAPLLLPGLARALRGHHLADIAPVRAGFALPLGTCPTELR